MTDFISIFIKACCCSCAAIGFGILFNTPRSILLFIGVGGFLAGLVKFVLMDSAIGSGIILGTAAAAGTVGIVNTLIALKQKKPPVIFLIPSVIPLIPGVFAYRTMLGLMKLAYTSNEEYVYVLSETVRNGVLTLFVVMAIAIGMVIPMLMLEKTIKGEKQ
jgi:uncharacterized membrane protein YjjB (DUF3815 family)